MRFAHIVFSVRLPLLLVAVVLETNSLFAATTTTLYCGAMLDGNSDTPKANVALEVTGDRISRITSFAPSHLPANSGSAINLSNRTCLPGLIDVHAHYIRVDRTLPKESRPVLEPVTRAYFARALHFGFTTLRELGSDAIWPSDITVRKQIDDGLFPAPRIKIALVYPEADDFSATTPEGWRRQIDHPIDLGADWIKLYGDHGWDGPPTYSKENLSIMVDEAHKRGIKVAVHAIGPEAAHQAIECHVDDIEHGVRIRDEDLKEMQVRGIVFVPTLFVLKYISLQPDADNPAEWVKQFQLAADTFRRALKANVKIAFGIDSGLEYWRFEQANPVQQIPLMVELGMSPTAAIKTITKNAAELLGLSNDLGTIERGKIADIVAAPGNPLNDTSRLEHIDFVMKAGKVYSAPK